jgi:imidazolonepropionase-like amidohydrolase
LISHWIGTQRAEAQEQRLVIHDVTVVDATGAASSPNLTVIVQESRIAAIIPSDRVTIQQTDQVVEGTGKFLIPGLWDMHVHLGGHDDAAQALPKYLASGVTGLRDMASPPDDIIRLRNEIVAGAIVGPAVVAAGPILQGVLPFEPPPMIQVVADARDAASTVEALLSVGVDFIKTGDTLGYDSYMALAAEAGRRGVPFAGHLPVSVSARDASEAGQKSAEHFGSARFHGLLIACSEDERALRAIAEETLDRARAGGASPDDTLLRAPYVNRLLNSYSSVKAEALFAEFASNGTWQTPTLVGIRSVWEAQQPQLNQQDAAAADRLWRKYEELVRAMQASGVGILAGTDLPDSAEGGRIHDELALLVDAGLSPMEALQTATRNPAEFFGRLDAEGTIEVGKTANLVLIDADPTQEISNTRRISAVVLGGRLIATGR